MSRPIDTDPVANVVQLDAFRAPAPAPLGDRSHLAQVRAYWEGLRGGRLLPDRADVESRGIGDALRHSFVLERISGGLARLRVAGRSLSDLMGMEVRGMPLSALFTAPAREELADALTRLFDEPAIVTLELRSKGGLGRPELRGRMILLPLRSDLGDVTRALGCVVMEGEMGRAPRRLEVTHSTCRTLIGFGYPPSPGVPRDDVPEPARGFAETTESFTLPKDAPSRGNLRLVKSDD